MAAIFEDCVELDTELNWTETEDFSRVLAKRIWRERKKKKKRHLQFFSDTRPEMMLSTLSSWTSSIPYGCQSQRILKTSLRLFDLDALNASTRCAGFRLKTRASQFWPITAEVGRMQRGRIFCSCAFSVVGDCPATSSSGAIQSVQSMSKVHKPRKKKKNCRYVPLASISARGRLLKSFRNDVR